MLVVMSGHSLLASGGPMGAETVHIHKLATRDDHKCTHTHAL